MKEKVINNKITNILFVLTYYRPHWTGLTQYAARVAEGLARKGHNVTVICSQHQKNLPMFDFYNQVKIIRVPFLCRFLRSVIMPSFPIKIFWEICKNKTVVVYLPLQQVILVSLITKILGKKLYLVHNGDLVLPTSCGFLCRLIEKIYFITTYLSIKLAEGVVIQSEDYANNSRLLSKVKNKWRLILPLFELPKVNTKEIQMFKKKYGLNHKILIGFSGRFVEEKGVDLLLNSLPLLVKKIPNIVLLMAGDYKIKYESFWPKIEKLINKNKNNIKLLGLLDGKDIYTFYKVIDILVQPSRTDCFPSSQIEALLSGTPSVCANTPGARWVVKKTGMGIVTNSLSAKLLADSIEMAINKKAVLIKKYKVVKNLFNYDITLNEYDKLFR